MPATGKAPAVGAALDLEADEEAGDGLVGVHAGDDFLTQVAALGHAHRARGYQCVPGFHGEVVVGDASTPKSKSGVPAPMRAVPKADQPAHAHGHGGVAFFALVSVSAGFVEDFPVFDELIARGR